MLHKIYFITILLIYMINENNLSALDTVSYAGLHIVSATP